MKKTKVKLGLIGLLFSNFFTNAYAANIDLLVLYGGNAKRMVEQQTTVSIETYINFLVSSANDIYESNGLDVNLRIKKIDDALEGYDPVPSASWIRPIINWPTAQDLRAEANADLVVVIGTAASGACGIAAKGEGSGGQLNIARSMPQAYSISAIDCGPKTFVHEIGHNMGLDHSIAQRSVGGVFDYGVGHGSNRVFTTLMAYPSAYRNAPRLNFFSDPDNTACKGRACGIRNRADSVRALIPVIDTVASYSLFLD